jgi:hypothetical protein
MAEQPPPDVADSAAKVQRWLDSPGAAGQARTGRAGNVRSRSFHEHAAVRPGRQQRALARREAANRTQKVLPIMTVLTISITDQTGAFDKRSAEVQWLAKTLDLIGTKLRNTQGNVSTATNVLGTSALGVPNSIVASYTYATSANNP